MKISTAALSLALTLFAVNAARADSDPSCPATGNTVSLEQAAAKAQGLGYAVKEIKRSKGCWKIEGYDRNGAEIEVRFDPTSGDVVKPRGWRAPAGG